MQYLGQRLCLHQHPSADIRGKFGGDEARGTAAID